MHTVTDSHVLRNVYQFKWWRPASGDPPAADDCWAVMYNCSSESIRAGDQVFFTYGLRSNSYLLQHYGFCLEENPYDNLRMRVICGTKPEAPIENSAELLPNDKLLADEDNLDTTTELLTVYSHKYSSSLFNYLRSVL